MIEAHYKFPSKSEITKTKLTLLLVCDQTYFKYLETLIASIQIFSPRISIWVHIINPGTNTLDNLKKFNNSLTNMIVSLETTNLDEYSEELRKTYYACTRFIILPKVLKYVNSKFVFVMDVDALVINPIETKFCDQPFDIGIFKRDHTSDKRMKVAAGGLAIKVNANSVKFCNELSSQVMKAFESKQARWFIDQVTLYEISQKYETEISIQPLKSKFLDWNCDISSTIWSAKGNRKKHDGKYTYLANILNFWLTEDKNSGFLQKLILDFKKVPASKEKRILLILPRTDLTWKSSLSGNQLMKELSDDVIDLRLQWSKFITKLAFQCEKIGIHVDIEYLPAWKITPDYVDSKGYLLAAIPHRTSKQFRTKTPTLFYMQEYFRWIFTINEKGWSSLSSKYPVKLENCTKKDRPDCFKKYQNKIKKKELITKFNQSNGFTIRDRIYKGHLFKKFIFCPIQVPHDQSIKFHSDVGMDCLVKHLVCWCKTRRINLVLKPHPANMQATSHFKSHVDNKYIFWEEGNIYSIIGKSYAIYTVNSGAGFESLLFEKPVVTFGRAEYDCVTHRGKVDHLDIAWDHIADFYSNKLKYIEKYKDFLNWFLQDYAVDLSDAEISDKRLIEVSKEIDGIITA